MPALGDRWRLFAPDLPGFGYTRAAANRFAYTFDAYADFLRRFTDVLGLTRYAIFLQDYGSQFGLRLAMSAPERVAALIVQNGDIYEDEHGPKYAPLKELWAEPNPKALAGVAEHVSEIGFRGEFVGEVPDEIADRISPDLWTLSWAQVGRPPGPENLVHLLADQRTKVEWFPVSRPTCASTSLPRSSCGGRTTGTCPRALPARTSVTFRVRNCTCSMVATGYWKPISTRSCR
jgi:pimeloyl-ACP methyl ester carboxylesterase